MEKNKINEQKEAFFNNVCEFCDALLQSLSLSLTNQVNFIKFLEELEITGGRALLVGNMRKQLSESTKDDQDAYKQATAFLKFTKQQWDNLGKEGKDITFN